MKRNILITALLLTMAGACSAKLHTDGPLLSGPGIQMADTMIISGKDGRIERVIIEGKESAFIINRNYYSAAGYQCKELTLVVQDERIRRLACYINDEWLFIREITNHVEDSKN